MPGRNVRRPTKRSMGDPGDSPTEDRVARCSEPCGARSDRGSLDQGLSRHERPTTEEGAEQDALFYEKGRRRPRERVEMRMPEEDPSHRAAVGPRPT